MLSTLCFVVLFSYPVEIKKENLGVVSLVLAPVNCRVTVEKSLRPITFKFFYLESLTSSRLYARVNERCRRGKGSLNLLLSENEDRNRRGHSVGFFLLLFVRLKKCLCLEYIEHIIVVAMVSLKNVT